MRDPEGGVPDMSAWGYEPYHCVRPPRMVVRYSPSMGVAPTLESGASHGKNIHNSDAAGRLRRLGGVRCIGQRRNRRRVRRSLRQ